MRRRLVHLDLKGAAPRAPYLEQVLPLFHALGATGLLLEYEDTFPYTGPLEPLRAPHAYSPAELRAVLSRAREQGLDVVPLVQSFGHMEFVLKHREFSHLREVPALPNALNPHKEESLALVKAMIDQVMALHEGLEWLHIGCDEVYYLGEGEESKQWLQQPHNTPEKLCLAHIKAVASCVASSYPRVTPIVWDDMLRGMSEETLAESGVPQLVQPMIWDYAADLHVEGKGGYSANVPVPSFSLLLSLLSKWNAVVQDLQAAMEQVFHPCAIEEWMEENVHPSLQKLQQVVDDLDEAIKAQN